MELILPGAEYARAIAAFRQEFLDFGGDHDGMGSLVRESVDEWLLHTREKSLPETCPPDLVPCTQFLYYRKEDRKIVGAIQVRHYFNEYLEKYAGHIGYSVCPSERRRGYAKEMLRAVLPYCRDTLGLNRVLISCKTSNEASRRTILACGGVYEKTVREPKKDMDLERYWIEL